MNQYLMFKRPLALLLCFLMLTLPLAGCLNSGTDPATSDDDLVLGELPDDWPTYYVPSASDLPACPGQNDANLGKLYYVEDVADFQACTSTGWSSVDTSGLTNHPPKVTVRLETNDDFSSGGDPNEPWVYRAFMQWSANDPEGTAVSVGVDHDRDGVVDLALPAAEGVDAGTTNQMIEIPWNGTFYANRWTNLEPMCGLSVYRVFDVIAEDATGMRTVHTVITDAVQDDGRVRFFWEYNLDSVEALFPTLSSDDIDWLSGDLPGSPCTWAPTPVYTTTFDASVATTGTTATDDVLADLVLTYTTGSGLGVPEVSVSISVDGGAYMPCAELVAATSQSTDCAFSWLFGGSQTQVSVGNGIRIFENGQDLCATSTGCSVEWKVDVFQQGQMTSAYPGNWNPSDSGYAFNVVDHGDAPSTATDDGLFDLTMTQGSDINLAAMRLVLKIDGTYHECHPSSSYQCDKVLNGGGQALTVNNALSIVENGADLCSGSCTIEYWVSDLLDRTTLAKGIITVS